MQKRPDNVAVLQQRLEVTTGVLWRTCPLGDSGSWEDFRIECSANSIAIRGRTTGKKSDLVSLSVFVAEAAHDSGLPIIFEFEAKDHKEALGLVVDLIKQH